MISAKHNIFILILAGAFLCAMTPFFASAQYQNIIVTVNPDTPTAHQNVTVNIESYTTNLNSANIIWAVNGQPTKEGVGEKSLTTQTLDFGQKTTIDITILSKDFPRIDKQIVIIPAEVDLLWEADTYTPPFYKGKALPTYKSNVRAVAIPRFNSTQSDPKSFYYKWSIGGTRGLGEGTGRMSTLVPMGWPDSRLSVVVDVSSDKDTSYKGRATQSIGVTKPVVVLYEDAPLLGVRFDHALTGTAEANGTDFRIHAYPYFVSRDDYDAGSIVYQWRKNSARIVDSINPAIMTIPKEGTAAETFLISVSAQNAKRVLQEGRAETSVSFAAETGF